MMPVIDKESCTGCGACAEACPPQALFLEGGRIEIKQELCEECGFCAAECPVEAIRIIFPSSGDPVFGGGTGTIESC